MGAMEHQRRAIDAVQAVLQLGVVHVGLPGHQRHGFLVAGEDAQLFIALALGRKPALFRIGHGQGVEFGLGRKENIGYVELVARPDLDAHRRHQHDARNAACVLGGQIRRHPTAQRGADEGDVLQIQLLQSIQVDVNEVVDRIHPERQA